MSIEEKEINIIISDTGTGIPQKDIAHIFQPFYRVNDNTTDERFGLGLSLAFRIIRLYKGNITVRSGIGKGSIFTVSIPSGKKVASLLIAKQKCPTIVNFNFPCSFKYPQYLI